MWVKENLVLFRTFFLQPSQQQHTLTHLTHCFASDFLCQKINRRMLCEKTKRKYQQEVSQIRMGFWSSVRSRWLDIDQVLFFRVFMDRDEVEVHKFAKIERGQHPAILTEQTWSINDLLYGFWGNFACGIQWVVPSAQDGSILPARVANHSARFGSPCPLAELVM